MLTIILLHAAEAEVPYTSRSSSSPLIPLVVSDDILGSPSASCKSDTSTPTHSSKRIASGSCFEELDNFLWPTPETLPARGTDDGKEAVAPTAQSFIDDFTRDQGAFPKPYVRTFEQVLERFMSADSENAEALGHLLVIMRHAESSYLHGSLSDGLSEISQAITFLETLPLAKDRSALTTRCLSLVEGKVFRLQGLKELLQALNFQKDDDTVQAARSVIGKFCDTTPKASDLKNLINLVEYLGVFSVDDQ